MKIPRNVNAGRLIAKLHKVGFEKTRQRGSHIILASSTPPNSKLIIPNYNPIAVGTLQAILSKVAKHGGISVDELLLKLKL